MKPSHILIMGASGDYNLGDELIVESEIRYFHDRFPEATITVGVHDPSSQIDRPQHTQLMTYFPYNIRKNFFKNIRYAYDNIKTLIRSDIVVIGGGGIFFDNEQGISFKKMVWKWYFRVWIARLFGAKIIFFGISLELKNSDNIHLLKKIFGTRDTVLTRDKRSTKLLDSINIQATTISDVAFLSQSIVTPKISKSIRRIGISLRAGFLHTDKIQEIIDFFDTGEYEIILLSHSFHPHDSHNDAALFDMIHSSPNISSTCSLMQTLDAYETLDAVVGMRFHSIVLSALHAIPIIPVSYGPKTHNLSKELELDTLMMTIDDWSRDDFYQKWNHMKAHYNMISQHIYEKSSLIQEKLLQQLGSRDILDI